MFLCSEWIKTFKVIRPSKHSYYIEKKNTEQRNVAFRTISIAIKSQYYRLVNDIKVTEVVLLTLHEKLLQSEFFWSVFCRIWTEYGEILCIRRDTPYFTKFSPNGEKYGPEMLRIQTLSP